MKDYLLGKRKDKWTGARIVAFRGSYGLSQAELAKLLGCRQQTVSDWELLLREPSWSFSSLLTNLENSISDLWLESGQGAVKHEAHQAAFKKLLTERLYGKE